MKTPNERRSELSQIFLNADPDTAKILTQLIDDVVYLETTLDELRKLPKIRVNPKNPAQQKATPAAKMYKEFLQQYNNCVKILATELRRTAPEEESPLRDFLKSLDSEAGR